MGKKKKRNPPAPSRPAAPLAPPVKAGFDFAEVWQHPTLLLAAISVAFTFLSAVLAYQFRNDVTMGAIREPTGMILWGAIAVTLFASYWRERRKSGL